MHTETGAGSLVSGRATQAHPTTGLQRAQHNAKVRSNASGGVSWPPGNQARKRILIDTERMLATFILARHAALGVGRQGAERSSPTRTAYPIQRIAHPSPHSRCQESTSRQAPSRGIACVQLGNCHWHAAPRVVRLLPLSSLQASERELHTGLPAQQ